MTASDPLSDDPPPASAPARARILPAAAPRGDLRVFRLSAPEAALSILVQLSLSAPAFSSQRFGTWARVLIGQVNRGDYLILSQNGRPVGFAGWFLARKADAEAWLEHEVDIPVAPAEVADCAVLNAFMAPSPEATRYLHETCMTQAPTISMIYAKRVKQGRRRLVRVPNPQAADPQREG
jgi:hemolysin-activating ACP:hemolysin acyltransferase